MIDFIRTESQRKANAAEACGCSGRKRRNKISAAILAFLLNLALLSPAIAAQAESDLSPANPAAAAPSQTADPTAGTSETSSITVLLDGEPVSFDAQPEIPAGATFVPLRSIFEQLGAEVEWNQQRPGSPSHLRQRGNLSESGFQSGYPQYRDQQSDRCSLSERRPCHGSPALSERVSGV